MYKGGGSQQLYYHDCSEVREQRPRTHHKGATGRVLTGDQLYPVLCHCQLGQDISTIGWSLCGWPPITPSLPLPYSWSVHMDWKQFWTCIKWKKLCLARKEYKWFGSVWLIKADTLLTHNCWDDGWECFVKTKLLCVSPIARSTTHTHITTVTSALLISNKRQVSAWGRSITSKNVINNVKLELERKKCSKA